MTNASSITPEELLSATRTLASIDVVKFNGELKASKGFNHIIDTLDRYVPNWRTWTPAQPTGTAPITIVGRASYAIRKLATVGPVAPIASVSEAREKALAWEKIVGTLDQFVPAWRQVNGQRLDDRAVNAIAMLAKNAGIINDPKTAIGAWKMTAETLDKLVPGWYPGENACIATHASKAITDLHSIVTRSIPEPNGDRLSAWVRVVNTLHDVAPDWRDGIGGAVEHAVSKIRELADKAKAYDEMMAALDAQASGWDESRTTGVTRARMAAQTVSEAFKANKADKSAKPAHDGAVEFRLVKGDHVPIAIVEEFICAAANLVPVHAQTNKTSRYRIALDRLNAAMAQSPAKVILGRKTTGEPDIPLGTITGKIGYVTGWNHLLAEVATQHIVNLQTPSNLTDEQCERIYEALHGYAQTVNMNNYGLPKWPDGSHRNVANAHIRAALAPRKAASGPSRLSS